MKLGPGLKMLVKHLQDAVTPRTSLDSLPVFITKKALMELVLKRSTVPDFHLIIEEENLPPIQPTNATRYTHVHNTPYMVVCHMSALLL